MAKAQTKRKAPSHALSESIGFLESIDRSLGRGPFTRDLIVEALGHKAASGPFNRKVGALLHFNLLQRDGVSYRIAELGEKILRPQVEGEKRDALAEAVTEPKLYRELINRFRGQPVPPLLKNILVREFGVHQNSGGDVAKMFLSSLEYAGLLRNQIVHDTPQISNSKHVPENDAASTNTTASIREVSGNEEFKLNDLDNGSQRREQFTLHAGTLILEWPSSIDIDEVEDIEAWLKLIVRKMKRAISIKDDRSCGSD